MASQQTGSDRFISRQRPQGRGNGVKGVWETTAVPGVCRMTLLLLASGYLGLRMMALEAQLKSLGALTELLLHSREWVGVHSSQSKSTGRRGAGRTLSQPPLPGKKHPTRAAQTGLADTALRNHHTSHQITQVVLQVDSSSDGTQTDKRLHSSRNTPSLTNPL